MRKTIVKVVAVHEELGVANWPCIDHDWKKEFKRIMNVVEGNNPDMQFDSVDVTDVSQVEATYEADKEKYDGVLVLLFTCWKGVDLFYSRQSATGIPTIIADVPYCGSGSVLRHASQRVRDEKLQTVVLSTLSYKEVAETVRLFDVLAKIKQTKILVIRNNVEDETQDSYAIEWQCQVSQRDELEKTKQIWFSNEWGCEFINRTSHDLIEEYEKVSDDEAKVIADRWIKEAIEIREATDYDILQSAKLYIAISVLMEKTGADAVTLDCLSLSYGGSYGEEGHMYPCLSHYEMLNNGIVAVCEADLCSTITSLVTRYLTNKPGFVSDPVVDTSSNQIIYSHCVACPKVYGYDDNRICPHAIRSHAEDNKGAAVQVYFPHGEAVTTLMIYPKEYYPSTIHSGTAVGNVGYQEACRSKLAAEVNAEKILNNWVGEWHRVTVYGNYVKQLERLFKLKGISYTLDN